MEVDVAFGLPAHERLLLARKDRRSVVGFNADHAARERFFAEDAVHVIVEKETDVLALAGGFVKRTHDGGAVRARGARTADTVLPLDVMGAKGRHAGAVVGLEVVGSLVLPRQAVRGEEVERGCTVVGECVLEVTVAEAIVGHAVDFGHGPVDEVAEVRFRIVLDAVLLLQGRAAAETDRTGGQDGVAAHVIVGVNDENVGAFVGRADGGRDAAGTRADHDDVGFKVPLLGKRIAAVGRQLGCTHAGDEKRSACHGGRAEEAAAGQTLIAHAILLFSLCGAHGRCARNDHEFRIAA